LGQPAVARLAALCRSFGREAYLVTRRRRVELQVWRDFDRPVDHRCGACPRKRSLEVSGWSMPNRKIGRAGPGRQRL